MRIPRFYLPLTLSVGQTLMLSDSTFRHAVQVLRLKPGQPIILFNGLGGEYHAVLERIERRQASANIEAFKDYEVESPLAITLIQAISKGERMDYTLQKAVELGVCRIIPVMSERSVVNLSEQRQQKRLRHWQGVIISACEQCGRNRLPMLSEPVVLNDYLRNNSDVGLKLLLNPTAKHSLNALTLTVEPLISLLIGPEGGLSDREIGLAEQTGFIGIRLGPRVLRTETAGMAALTALQMRWGDLA